MSEDIVKIKGTSLGLQLSFAPEASFEDMRRTCRQNWNPAPTFFLRGTLVLIPRDVLTGSERDELQRLFHEHGLICRTQQLEPSRRIIWRSPGSRQLLLSQPAQPAPASSQES